MSQTLDAEEARARRATWGAMTTQVKPGTILSPTRPRVPINIGGGGTSGGGTTGGGTSGGGSTGTNTQTRAQVIVQRIYCSCTTEQGHDEMYYLWGGVNGAGKEVSHRGPDAWQAGDADNATAWDMNDSGDEQNRQVNACIYDEALQPGQTATFACTFYESDGQDYGSTVSGAGKLASSVGGAIGQPIVTIAGMIVGWIGSLIPKNQDDFLGGFSLRLSNEGGTVSVSELAASTYGRVISWNKSTNQFTMGFRHDDGDYVVDFHVVGR